MCGKTYGGFSDILGTVVFRLDGNCLWILGLITAVNTRLVFRLLGNGSGMNTRLVFRRQPTVIQQRGCEALLGRLLDLIPETPGFQSISWIRVV
jgi:hypothetical protein